MKRIKKLLKPIYIWLLDTYFLVNYWIYCRKYGAESIVLFEGYIRYGFFTTKKYNWGDDLNKYFFNNCSDKRVFCIPYSKLTILRDKPCYTLIGSILGFFNLDNKYVYGSGVLVPEDGIQGTPLRIYSVRGPRTRALLLEHGIDCPERYGDPALLLPLVYKPTVEKRKGGVLIPNMGTTIEKNAYLEALAEALNCRILTLRTYDKWTDVIDRICESEFVVSESLHGLIVAETYGIPNVWVETKNHPNYWEFKFRDYYESIGKTEEIIRLQQKIDQQLINSKIQNWKKGYIDYSGMLEDFPFPFKTEVR